LDEDAAWKRAASSQTADKLRACALSQGHGFRRTAELHLQ